MRTLMTLAALALATPALAQEISRPPVDQAPPPVEGSAPICIDADPPVQVPDTAVLAAKFAAFEEPAGLSAPQLRRLQNAARAFNAGHDEIAVRHIAAAVTEAIGTVGIDNFGDADIEAIAFIVLSEAVKSEQADLRMVMAEIKHINEQKESLRDHANELNDIRSDALENCIDNPNCDRATLAAIDARLAQLDSDKDSLSELGEEQQLRLQSIMDRKQRLVQTLSNILKKTSDTAQAITQNLK
jgi:hypothetical protein